MKAQNRQNTPSHLNHVKLPVHQYGTRGWLNVDTNIWPTRLENGESYPTISIVTPSYNQANFIEETIRSVLSQGYPRLEYIVMDGGSTDNSREIIQKYGPWLSFWQSERDNGQYDAVQKGLDRSHGEIMAYLNSDDLYFPWTFKVVAEIFSTFPQVEWLTTSNVAVASEDSRFSFVGRIHNRSRRWFFRNRGERLKTGGFIPQEATFWRRSLWERAGSRMDTRLKYAGDLELWARFYGYANLVMVNMPLALFRHHGEQKTRQFERYVDEANRVLARYPTPVWLPRISLRILNHLWQSELIKSNRLGTRCDKINFLPLKNRWQYDESLVA